MGRGESKQSSGFEEAWKRRFTNYARLRDDDAGIAGWSPTGLETRFRFFRHHWPGAKPGGLWLDVGCGAGTYSRFLARSKQQVVGLDYSLPSLEKAKARTAEDVCWMVGDAQELPLDSGAVDGVLCFGVTQALEQSQGTVEETARVLAAGGELWIDGLNGWCLPHIAERVRRWLRGSPPHLRFESPYGLRGLVQKAGFKQVRIMWLPMLPGRLRALQPLFDVAAVRLALRWTPGLGALLSHSMVITGRRKG